MKIERIQQVILHPQYKARLMDSAEHLTASVYGKVMGSSKIPYSQMGDIMLLSRSDVIRLSNMAWQMFRDLPGAFSVSTLLLRGDGTSRTVYREIGQFVKGFADEMLEVYTNNHMFVCGMLFVDVNEFVAKAPRYDDTVCVVLLLHMAVIEEVLKRYSKVISN